MSQGWFFERIRRGSEDGGDGRRGEGREKDPDVICASTDFLRGMYYVSRSQTNKTEK